MRRFALLSLLIFAAGQIGAIDLDLTGEWLIFRVSALSRYLLNEHLVSKENEPLANNTLILNDDGTVTTDLPGMIVESWQMDEGFLLFKLTEGNRFFHPRILSAESPTVLFLVQVDVLERNEEVINITSRQSGNLIAIRP